MAGFYVPKKSAPSSAGKAASGVASRMSKNAGKKGAPKTGKGHFAAAAQRVAKLRSGNLQHGVPKHAPMGAMGIAGSMVPPKSGMMQASPAQQAMNEEQE